MNTVAGIVLRDAPNANPPHTVLDTGLVLGLVA